MTPDLQALIGKWREMADEATPGPWLWETSDRLYAQGNGYIFDGNTDDLTKANADFIALSRTLIPALLDVAEATCAQQVGDDCYRVGHGLRKCEMDLPLVKFCSYCRASLALARLAEVGNANV